MFIRKYWLPLSVFIVAIVGIGLYLLATQPEKPPIVIYKPVEPLPKSTEQPKAEVPVEDTSQGRHFHEDGTWHEGPHEQEAAAQETPQTEKPQPQEALSPEEQEARRQAVIAAMLEDMPENLALREKNRDILKRSYERLRKEKEYSDAYFQRTGRRYPGEARILKQLTEAKTHLDAQEQDIANLTKWRDEHANK